MEDNVSLITTLAICRCLVVLTLEIYFDSHDYCSDLIILISVSPSSAMLAFVKWTGHVGIREVDGSCPSTVSEGV